MWGGGEKNLKNGCKKIKLKLWKREKIENFAVVKEICKSWSIL